MVTIEIDVEQVVNLMTSWLTGTIIGIFIAILAIRLFSYIEDAIDFVSGWFWEIKQRIKWRRFRKGKTDWK